MLSSTLITSGSLILATLLQVPPPTADSAQSVQLRGRRDEILARERSRLSGLADRLRVEGKVAEAGQVAPGPAEAPAADGSSRFVPLPEVVPAGPRGLANVEV